MKSLVAAAALVVGLVSGCSAASDPAATEDDGRMPVTAAFYPLQFVAERVGGDNVQVTTLTRPGTEPHDLELTPKAVAALAQSRAVLYLTDFQPAVQEAVRSQASDAGVDVSPAARLLPDVGRDEGEEGEGLAGMDPHFWLDPTRLADVSTAVGEDFARRDPENAAAYRANAAALAADLEALDEEYRTGLAECASRDLVTAHTAFAYLADRYDLTQEGVAGVSPDVEPDAASLQELTARVRETGVTTVYTETLVSPALAETVAREAGAGVAVLDPLEGLTEASAGEDYLEVMRANLRTLREGQGCT